MWSVTFKNKIPVLDSELGSYFIKAEKLNMHPKKKESQLIVSMKHWFFFISELINF